jgi:hypothetical protein
MLRRILFFALLAAGCGDSSPAYLFDAGADFAIGPQTTHIGAPASACCLSTRGAELAMYLASPTQGTIDSDGNDHPAHGELHVANAYGVDFALATKVPAGGYTFTPDGLWAMYLAPSKTFSTADPNYSLNFAPVTFPDVHMGMSVQAIPAGVDDLSLGDQGFFSPSGHFFIVGVLRPNVLNSADLHVVDVNQGKDVFDLGQGAFSYLELMAPDDTMIYENSTASTVAGQPSVQGLYVINLNEAAAGTKPALIDQHTAAATLLADGHSLIYERANQDLMYYDLRDKFFIQLASNVSSFSVGPTRLGPIVYIDNNRGLHVLPKLSPEIASLPAATADVLSPIIMSPDAQHLYYFQHVDSENAHGVLYHLRLNSNDQPQLVGLRVSTTTISFFQEQLIYLDNVSSDGSAGDLFVSNLDGTGAKLMGTGAATGEVLEAFPVNFGNAPHSKTNYGPADFAPIIVPPVFANLTNAVNDPTKIDDKRLMNGGRAIVGGLAFGPKLGSPEAQIDPAVHTGTFSFSDDGFTLAYASGATWSDQALNYVGTLQLFPTVIDIGIKTPMLTSVSEIGPIFSRSFFALAPDNATPGLYFINF